MSPVSSPLPDLTPAAGGDACAGPWAVTTTQPASAGRWPVYVGTGRVSKSLPVSQFRPLIKDARTMAAKLCDLPGVCW
ncbi:hypothetical protein [Microbispora sp. NBC_01389]|uniref:hypothetical protein n=1 Tax=Microbispora sp. NBC_01389 TaxID=2903584 RepID=UPI003248EC1E